jgi:hypothetical protein
MRRLDHREDKCREADGPKRGACRSVKGDPSGLDDKPEAKGVRLTQVMGVRRLGIVPEEPACVM